MKKINETTSVLCADLGGTGVRYSAILGPASARRLTRNLISLGRRAQRHGARGVVFDCRKAHPDLRLDETDIIEALHAPEHAQPPFKVCYLFPARNRCHEAGVTHSVFRRGLEAQCRSSWRDAQLFFGLMGHPDPIETPSAYAFVRYILPARQAPAETEAMRRTG